MNRHAICWSDVQALLLDLDGTVYHEDTPLPGGAELVRTARALGKVVAFVSNSNASPDRIVQRLRTMHIDTAPEHIFTAAKAACDVVAERYPARHQPGQTNQGTTDLPRVFNLATDSVYELLAGRAQFVESADDPCDAIVIGTPVSRHAHPDRQRIALHLARAGADLIGVCADRVFPSPRGLEFGAGALSHMLGYATQRPVIYCGKPERVFFDQACAHLRLPADRCVLVGDNVEADIFGARRAGMKTILTLTGIARAEDVAHLPPDHQPHATANNLLDVLHHLTTARS